MPKHKKSEIDDNTLRAFYEACGLSQQTIEGAIRQRYEEPTNFVGRQKSIETARATYARKREVRRKADEVGLLTKEKPP